MRTILFRGLRTDGKWVYGDLLTNHPHHPNEFVILEGGCINHEIIKETVGQFTGLKDRKGEDLYEGDIINKDFYGMCIIVWNEEICAFQYAYEGMVKGTAIGGRITNTLFDNEANKFEISGNIHDNPHLLK